jgi:hypothetical protein
MRGRKEEKTEAGKEIKKCSRKKEKKTIRQLYLLLSW